jgi:hypothetical protein
MYFFSIFLQGLCEMALVKTQSCICYDWKGPVAWSWNNSVVLFRVLSAKCTHCEEVTEAN